MLGSAQEVLAARLSGFVEELRGTRIAVDGRYGVVDDHIVTELALGMLGTWVKADDLAMVGWVRRNLAAWEDAGLASETFVGIALALADEFTRYLRKRQNETGMATPQVAAEAALRIRQRAHTTVGIATARLGERCAKVRSELVGGAAHGSGGGELSGERR